MRAGSPREAPSGAVRRDRRPWCRWSLVLAVVLTASFGCTVASSAQGPRNPDQVGVYVVPVSQRQPAPHLAGTTLSGARFDLADHLGGQIILVNVWASWCAPCRQEMPTLARAAATERGSRLLVVGLDERDRASSARAFSSSLGATYASLVDDDSQLLAQLPMLPHNAVPSSLFIDTEGKIAAVAIGPITSPQIASVLSRLEVAS